jgi:hypothetical protein
MEAIYPFFPKSFHYRKFRRLLIEIRSSGILDEVAALALSETKKTGSFTLPGIGKLVLVKRKARMVAIRLLGSHLKFLLRPW